MHCNVESKRTPSVDQKRFSWGSGDYHQSYAGAQGAKPMKMVLIRKLVFMVTGSYCDVTYAKRVTCACVCVCQQTFWDCPLSLHCQSHKMVANRRHRFHGGQWRLEMPMNRWGLYVICFLRFHSTSCKSVLSKAEAIIFDSLLILGFVRIQKYCLFFLRTVKN